MERKKIGSIGVDAGCVWIVDPCYVLDDRGTEPFRGKTWSEHCESLRVLDTPARSGQFEEGVVVSSGYGDGEYPVYAEYQDGRVKRVIIEFMEED